MDNSKLYEKSEIRSFSGTATPSISEGRTIEGYAIVFNQRSQVMYDFWEDVYFEEIILPEAVTPELIRSCDIKALMEHNRERLLARSNKGEGTLELEIDEVGLKYRFTAPNTKDGDDAIELVSRRDIGGSSFGFIARSKGCVEREWDKSTQRWLHRIRKFDAIFDVTLTSDPAYTQTSVNVRSLSSPQPKQEPLSSQASEEINMYRNIFGL